MMASMSHCQTFEIEMVDRTIMGTLYSPESPDKPHHLPGALICHHPKLSEEESLFIDAMVETLVEAGIAIVVYLARRNDDSAPLARDAVDDASAAFRWLALHESIDLSRLFLLGYGQGAVPASCLARRTDQLAGFCLLAPTPSYMTKESNGNGEKQHQTPDAAPLTPVNDAAYFDRPTLILCAGADKIIPNAESCIFLNAMEATGHDLEHLIIARTDHAFVGESVRRLCLEKITQFFKNAPAVVMSAEISQ